MANNQIHPVKKYNLRYTNEKDFYFYRKRKDTDFIYVNTGGKLIRDRKLIERFQSLVIPPAWKNVLICKDDKGHIQATGRDKRGRKQYIYHEKWEELSNTNKFNRLIDFGEALPKIRKQVSRDLRERFLIRNKVLAAIIKLMEETLIRIGNEIYAEQNKSYGLTTLQDKHIKVDGFTLNFQFNGKGGKSLNIAFTNKKLAKIVKKCQDIPGQQLFQYIDKDGKRHPVESADVNNYLNSIVEKNFTAKEFRTWGATVLAAEKLSKLPLSKNEKENNSNIVKAVKETANELNNTPSICRKYYIHPLIIESYLDGYLFKVMADSSQERKSRYGLNKEENAVLKILKKYKSKL